MNLLCPNCQKMLTVPEEYAGQLMKCPLCNGTFTVPGLPSSAPPPPPPPVPEPEVYGIRHDAVPPVSPPTTSPLPPLENSLSSSITKTPAPASSKPSLAPEDYQHDLTVWVSPRVLPWIAPACLLLIFFLQLFDWEGLYPGGVPAMSGNAWSTAFGAYSIDPDMKADFLRFLEDDKYKPGINLLTIFYLIPLFFVVLAVTIASVAIDHVPLKIPPAVDKFLPWRWGIVAAANLILFLFLALQLLLGFSLDNRYAAWVDKRYEGKETKTTPQQKKDTAERAMKLEQVHYTFALKLVVLLHLVAIVSALLMFWIHQRGTHRPLPRMELRW